MNKLFLATILLACSSAAYAQWDLEGVFVDKTKYTDYVPMWNPDPYIMTPGAGSIGSVQQSESPKGRKHVRKSVKTTELPDYWDNANTKYFPPVFDQAGGSCGVSSRAGYMLCEELNAYRGTDASHPDNRLAPNIQHPFDNTGPNKNTMAYQIGFPSATTYGGFPYSSRIGSYGPTSDVAGWMQGYDKWYQTMHNRIWGASSIPTPVIGYPEDNPEDWGRGGFGPGAIAAKRWLYNHNGDESFHTGGLLGLGVACGGHILDIPSSTENRRIGLVGKKYWVMGTVVDHAVTICGYDDRVEFDLDGNGKVGERKNTDGLDEKGAWIVVNSWGGWANKGFIYVPYALATPTCKSNASGKGYLPVGQGFTPEMWHIRKDYTPARTIKLKISFTQRSGISLKAGISKNLEARSPEKIMNFEHFNYKGDGNNDGKDAMTPMLGKWVDGMHYEPMEFGFDLTDLQDGYDPTQPLKFFFIIESKSSTTGVGGIHEAYIVDYLGNEKGIETPFIISGDSVIIGNKGRKTTLSTIVYGEALNAPQNLRISGTTLSWDAPSNSFTPQGYIVYRNGAEIGQTNADERWYTIGANGGTYTVKTIYGLNGGRHLSVPSAPIEGNASFTQTYINYIGNPISRISELKDGMSVVLYNVGRANYVCDTGASTYQYNQSAPSPMSESAFQYVFKVKKEGSTYTFTSANGSLPAFSSNDKAIPVSQTAGKFTVSVANSGNKTFYLKNGSFYLNGNENIPVTWSGSEETSQHRIIPVHVSEPEVLGMGDYTTVTTDNLMEGQIVALYNNGREYYIAEENGVYTATKTSPTSQSFNYLFRVGKKSDGTFTFTSLNGAIPVLPYGTTFAPNDNAESFTLTSAGAGLFYLQGATSVASADGNQECQYLNGNETAPVGWNKADANSVYRLYPVTMKASAPEISISAPTNIHATVPVQLSLTGDADIASCIWTIEGNTYTTIAPTITFESAGSKTVECTVVNMNGMSATANRTLTVKDAPDISISADFTASKSTIIGGESVSFLASNQLTGCTYHWDFPGTKELTANTRNASVVYTSVGQHNVTLTVTAPDGTTQTLTKTFTVELVPPVINYTLSDAVILKGESVDITDQSLYDPTAWQWTLLEEKNLRYQSNEQNPTFTPVPGRYNLLFTAMNEKGSATVNQKLALLVCNAQSYTGLEFSGGDERVTANLPAGISNAWTVEYWLNPKSLQSASVGIFGSNNLKITSNAAGAVTIKRGTTTLATSAKAYYKVGEWHHYAITYSSGKIYFYRDGVEVSKATSSVRDFSSNFTTIQLGGSDAPLEGMIDEFRVWNTALTGAKLQMAAIEPVADIPGAVQNDGLLLYYQFNQNSGNCIDATSYGNTGTRLDFGPDGDAWSDSRGVFALNLEDNGSTMTGGMLNQTFYLVTGATDEEPINETAPAANVVDGKDATEWRIQDNPTVMGYPHGITLDRGRLDKIYAIRFYAERSDEVAYLPTLVNIYESDDAATWTPIVDNIHLVFSANSSDVVLPSPVTRRFLKIEFPAGGSYLSLNEIYFYGQDGEVIDNQENIQSESGYTVTWRIYDDTGTKLWKLYKQTDVAAGTNITAVPGAINIKGCTYSSVSATVNSDITIDVRCTWDMFEASNDAETIYYNLIVRSKYARWDATAGNIVLQTSKPTTRDDTGKWAFFGNPYAGFLVMNAAMPDVYLSCKSGDKSYATIETGGTRFNVRKSDYQGNYFLLQVNKNNSYLNDYGNNGLLAVWADTKATSDIGSAFKATEVSRSQNTGITETFLNVSDEKMIYDLQGRRLNSLQRGINIVNGKKVLVR